jgi:hypothetical protein
MSSWMHALGGRLLLLAVTTLLCLVALEMLLRAFTHFPIHPKDANRRPHPALGYVMSSDLPEIDREGFRNPEDLRDVDLVAIGDSHTYGFNVVSAESWPAQLAERGRISVYNYGMGGYGILQYRWLFPRALEKEPETIILAMYPANDLGDYCTFSQLDHWESELRERGLARQACPGPGPGKKDMLASGSSADALKRLWLTTAVGSAFDYLLWREIDLRRNPNAFVPVTYGGHETFLSKARIGRHNRYTDLRKRPIAEAAHAAEVLLSEMIELARTGGVDLGVLFIPSKENVLLEAADPSDPFFEVLQRAVLQERAVAERLDRYLSERGVPTAHALDCLRTLIGVQLYTRDGNAHPLREGYACYAEAALTLLADAKAS